MLLKTFTIDQPENQVGRDGRPRTRARLPWVQQCVPVKCRPAPRKAGRKGTGIVRNHRRAAAMLAAFGLLGFLDGIAAHGQVGQTPSPAASSTVSRPATVTRDMTDMLARSSPSSRFEAAQAGAEGQPVLPGQAPPNPPLPAGDLIPRVIPLEPLQGSGTAASKLARSRGSSIFRPITPDSGRIGHRSWGKPDRRMTSRRTSRISSSW